MWVEENTANRTQQGNIDGTVPIVIGASNAEKDCPSNGQEPEGGEVASEFNRKICAERREDGRQKSPLCARVVGGRKVPTLEIKKASTREG